MDRTSDKTTGRQRWKYRKAVLVGVALGLALVLSLTRWYLPLPTITRVYGARFEWDSAQGFTSLKIEDLGGRGGGRAWQYLVAAQIKPRLNSYLRKLPFEENQRHSLGEGH